MKKLCLGFALFFLLFHLFPSASASETDSAAWGYVDGENIIVYLNGATAGETMVCQIGTKPVTISECTALTNTDFGIETVVLLDNSISIDASQREQIKALLSELAEGVSSKGYFTMVTVDNRLNWLCERETDVSKIKDIISNITFNDQKTQLSDGLYSMIKHLTDTDDGTLRRIVIIADGVDNKAVGYTHDELVSLIAKAGYPIYTVGCINAFNNSIDEQQNLFSLSRITSGMSFSLADVSPSSIADAVAQWDSSIRIIVQIPAELQDGSEKSILIRDAAGKEFVLSKTMPFGVSEPEPTTIPTVVTEPETMQTTAPATEPAPPQSEGIRIGLISTVVVIVLLVLAAVLSVILIILKKKKAPSLELPPRDSSHEDVEEKKPASTTSYTELLSDDEDGCTAILWDAQSGSMAVRIVLEDLSNSFQHFETSLTGSVKIGRSESNDIVIDYDLSVGRSQCEIYPQNGKVMLRNLSHSNITRVGSQRVEHITEVKSGDVITMGRVKLRLEIVQ